MSKVKETNWIDCRYAESSKESLHLLLTMLAGESYREYLENPYNHKQEAQKGQLK